MGQEIGFQDFFERGERLTDLYELAAFAVREEWRHDEGSATQLYRWTLELITELRDADGELEALRYFVEDAIDRLAPPALELARAS